MYKKENMLINYLEELFEEPEAMAYLRGSNEYLTNKINLDEIIGKTVVIHSLADDFRSQPAGDSGDKIACGEILRLR